MPFIASGSFIDANVVSENLDLKKSDPLREKYPELFKQASGLHRQCTILDHKYEVAGFEVEVNWNEFWTTLTDRFANLLEPLLKSAITNEVTHASEEAKKAS